jgi:hypothetical protein
MSKPEKILLWVPIDVAKRCARLADRRRAEGDANITMTRPQWSDIAREALACGLPQIEAETQKGKRNED